MTSNIQIALAALFGLILGSGATFAYLYMQDYWAHMAHEKTNMELAKALAASVKAGDTIKVKRVIKKHKKNEDSTS